MRARFSILDTGCSMQNERTEAARQEPCPPGHERDERYVTEEHWVLHAALALLGLAAAIFWLAVGG